MASEMQRYLDEFLEAQRKAKEDEQRKAQERLEGYLRAAQAPRVLTLREIGALAEKSRIDAEQLRVRQRAGQILVNIFEDAKRLNKVRPYPLKEIRYDPHSAYDVQFAWGTKLGLTSQEEAIIARYRYNIGDKKKPLEERYRRGFWFGIFPGQIVESYMASVTVLIDHTQIRIDEPMSIHPKHPEYNRSIPTELIFTNPQALVSRLAVVFADKEVYKTVLHKEYSYHESSQYTEPDYTWGP